nr:sensor histidine kinase [Treponema sp.]
MSKKNIRKSLEKSYLLITFVMLIPITYSILVARLHTKWYDTIISNVSEATELGTIAKQELVDEIWSIVSGQKNFNEGCQYVLLRKIRTGISNMDVSPESKSRGLLDVASRTENTLRYYVDALEIQMQNGSTVAENEAAMEDIRSVASLLYDIMQDFIVAEVENASVSNTRIRHSFVFLTMIQIAICLLILVTAMLTLHNVTHRIASSISDMSKLSNRIAGGDLAARSLPPKVEELEPLAANLDIMAEKLQNLIDENIREQRDLQKAEMKALQAQITPHFLYNTFDTIIWLSEAGEIEEVVRVTKAFSQFFRISLSRGHEWITVAEEIEHVESYLTIQKIRYANILDYTVETDSGIEGVPILKLLLQPLVENAIYHGIKNKRGRGTVSITARCVEDNGIRFTVKDNGIGFESDRLAKVLSEINGEAGAEKLSAAYGLYNVNKRLSLYYGDQVRLKIQSVHGEGTEVSFTIPRKVESGID